MNLRDSLIDDGFHPDMATWLVSTLVALDRLAGLRFTIAPTDYGWALIRPLTTDDDPSSATDGGVQVYEGPDEGVTAFAAGVVWAMGEPKAKPRGTRA